MYFKLQNFCANYFLDCGHFMFFNEKLGGICSHDVFAFIFACPYTMAVLKMKIPVSFCLCVQCRASVYACALVLSSQTQLTVACSQNTLPVCQSLMEAVHSKRREERRREMLGAQCEKNTLREQQQHGEKHNKKMRRDSYG